MAVNVGKKVIVNGNGGNPQHSLPFANDSQLQRCPRGNDFPGLLTQKPFWIRQRRTVKFSAGSRRKLRDDVEEFRYHVFGQTVAERSQYLPSVHINVAIGNNVASDLRETIAIEDTRDRKDNI